MGQFDKVPGESNVEALKNEEINEANVFNSQMEEEIKKLKEEFLKIDEKSPDALSRFRGIRDKIYNLDEEYAGKFYLTEIGKKAVFALNVTLTRDDNPGLSSQSTSSVDPEFAGPFLCRLSEGYDKIKHVMPELMRFFENMKKVKELDDLSFTKSSVAYYK